MSIIKEKKGSLFMECKKENNMQRCNCSYEPCRRKGLCCECLKYHFQNQEFPGCLFPDDVEKEYDRSIEKFIQIYQERGPWR